VANNEQELGSRLREIRSARNLTQAALAELVGVSRQTINYMEQGEYSPSTRLALQLARVLDATVEELFYLKDE
jgi:putative transcriptional regulator